MQTRRVKTLVVEDSPVVQLLLVHLLKRDPEIEVVGAVEDGAQALAFLQQNDADVVLMDVHMPNMDGFEATRRIMQVRPVPIVISSATMDRRDVTITFEALQAGALAFVEKPGGVADPEFDRTAANLIRTLKLMSEVKVVRRRSPAPLAVAPAAPPRYEAAGAKLVAIGVSTGGPPALDTLLKNLPKPFGAPLLIVQHMAPGFLDGLAEWLARSTGVAVQVARHDKLALPGCAYFAPDEYHLGITAGGRILLSREPPEDGLRPAVGHLFRSALSAYGTKAIGVLLTGMGRDGAEELKAMRDCGAITFAQDRESSVVHGMPGRAIALDAATYVLPPERIAEALAGLCAPA